MGEIERWKSCFANEDDGGMQTDPKGPYVLWGEHEQALAQVRREVLEEAITIAVNERNRWTRIDGERACDNIIAYLMEKQATLAGVKACQHEWGTDGQHSNEFCKRCFANKEKAGDAC